LKKFPGEEGTSQYVWLEMPDGSQAKTSRSEFLDHSLLPKGSTVFAASDLNSSHEYSLGKAPFEFKGKRFLTRRSLLVNFAGWNETDRRKKSLGRLSRVLVLQEIIGMILGFSRWRIFGTDTSSSFGERIYVVQTTPKTIQRCLLMTTDPGDLVLDITCGSGTTAFVAEQWGRRWLTCDTSRVALTLAKQRLMTAVFPYYQLAHTKPKAWTAASFIQKFSTFTMKDIANNELPEQETIYDDPVRDNSKTRVTGPFNRGSRPCADGEIAGRVVRRRNSRGPCRR